MLLVIVYVCLSVFKMSVKYNYIKSIKIDENSSDRFKKLKGKTIELYPGLNFLIGLNGIGKSSIINSIINYGAFQEIKLKTTGYVKTFGFDTEKMNPRVIPGNRAQAFDYLSHFMSHGETLIKCIEYIKDIPKENEDSYIILVDEPESGQHPKVQKKIKKMCESLSDRVQFLIATHSIILTDSKIGRLIELKEKNINYFDPPSSYDWKI